MIIGGGISAPSLDVRHATISRLDGMAWAELKHSPQEINAAGKTFIRMLTQDHRSWDIGDSTTYNLAVNVINNWRACHGYPLNTFQINLRHAARRYDAEPLIAQRTKRLASIAGKLSRFPSMKLTQMQDIGGCRAVVKSVAAVRELDTFYARVSNMKHGLSSRDDYIASPQASGYRGIHLVYRYFSDKKAKEAYNGRKIEMQIRSRYQHAWATAV
jgi:(p)ppGpp synthase/HD superfamily hydrolase